MPLLNFDFGETADAVRECVSSFSWAKVVSRKIVARDSPAPRSRRGSGLALYRLLRER